MMIDDQVRKVDVPNEIRLDSRVVAANVAVRAYRSNSKKKMFFLIYFLFDTTCKDFN